MSIMMSDNAGGWGKPQPSQQDLLNVISGGASLNGWGGYGYGASQPTVDMAATAYSTPVKLMQKFVNDRGWGDVNVAGMKDWQGNTLTNQTMAGFNANANADADRWAALAMLLQQMQNGGGYNYQYSGSNHDSTGAGGSGR
jgi:hypothetical protein